MLHWTELTKEQQSQFEGCGPGKAQFLIPQFIFKASCRQHDFYYWRGGNLIDKAKADTYFYVFMLEDVQLKPKHRWFYWSMATLYFVMVSIFGCFAFSWGNQKTLEDLIKD